MTKAGPEASGARPVQAPGRSAESRPATPRRTTRAAAASPATSRVFGATLLLGVSLAGWFSSAFLLMAGFGAATLPAPPLLPAAMILKGVCVGLDPGHGGWDDGVLLNEDQADEVREADINLAVALKLRDILERAGARVVLSRTTDIDLLQPGDVERYGNEARAELSRRAEAVLGADPDLFISIHCNAFSSSEWRGSQVFYIAAGGPPSRRLAEIVQGELARVTGETDRLANRRVDIFLLKKMAEASVPAVTAELGFLSNPRDLRLLTNPDYQHLCAMAVFFAVCRFLSLAPVGPAG